MRLQFLVPCLALALSTMAAGAQVGLYINPVATRISNSKIDPDPDPFGFLGANTTSRTFWGANIGGYYEFFHGSKADVSVDFRDSIVHGNGASLNSFLIGARVSGKPIATSFVPYAQLSGGFGSSKAPTSPIRLNRGTFDIYGGVDYRFSSHVDFRAVEVGYGTVSTVNSGDFGGPTSLGSSKLLNFSTGLVFRIPVPGVAE
ncbi:hypothetical protein [Tunturiibacter lichenicola]|uniref:hypothetical protein n=1 Tax=Tunturiibacter lichenicola TaxID=2051959 RepID=UPI003D9BBE70